METFPALLKTRRLGYDGKGQRLVETRPGTVPGHVLEERVDFDRELSLLAVRGRDGDTRFYPLVENVHEGGILRTSRAPAADAPQAEAEEYGTRLLDALGYVGVLALELFDVGGTLLANEFAPRVHNTGHWTIEGAATSQFENHLRAILGLPLGSTESRPSLLVNLIGSVPPTEAVLAIPGAHLHLYGKEPRPGRKLGHVTLVEPTPDRERARGLTLLTATSSVLAADGAVDLAAARRADAPAVLELERVLLQAREEHRVADRHREGDEGHDAEGQPSSGDVLCEVVRRRA